MGIKANRRRGHSAEAEAAVLSQAWPRFKMQRTGLDGGTDCQGEESIAEVKAVMSGPVWLRSMLAQLDSRETDKLKFGMLKLSKRRGNRTGWIVILDIESWENILDRLGD